jgi:hypothetical protein
MILFQLEHFQLLVKSKTSGHFSNGTKIIRHEVYFFEIAVLMRGYESFQFQRPSDGWKHAPERRRVQRKRFK